MIQKVCTIILSIFLWVGSVIGAEFKQFNQRELYVYFEGKQHKTGAIVSPFEEGGLKYQKFINSFSKNPNEYLGKTIMLNARRVQDRLLLETLSKQLKNKIKTPIIFVADIIYFFSPQITADNEILQIAPQFFITGSLKNNYIANDPRNPAWGLWKFDVSEFCGVASNSAGQFSVWCENISSSK